MDKTLTTDIPPETREGEGIDYKAAIADLFTQIDSIDERIKSNQSETERLRAETWVMLAQMQVA